MNQCPECKIDYPKWVHLSPLMINGEYTKPICGCCALELMNKRLGSNQKAFRKDTVGESYRQNALAHRKQINYKAE
jgi:hypothetical protein